MKENNHTTQQNTFELLAPAGSLAIFKAVVAAGADAVYVGGSKFGARAYADNFSDEELLEALTMQICMDAGSILRSTRF